MSIRKLATAALLFAAALVASSARADDVPHQGPDKLDRIKSIKRLPVRAMSVVETVDGKVYLQSDDGRLVIIGGRWYDMWTGNTIHSVDDAKSFDKVDLARMGVKADELFTVKIGTGPKHVTAFVDPYCNACRELMTRSKALSHDFTFEFVLTPMLGAPSADASKKLACGGDKSLALPAMLAGDYKSLPAARPDCDVLPLQKAMLVATFLNVRKLPYVVKPDGFTIAGPAEEVIASLTQTVKKQ